MATSPITEMMLDGIVVGFEDRITVGLDESVTVPDEIVAEIGPSVDRATTKADMVDVTTLDPATTFAVLAPLMIETAPEDTEVMVGLDDRITVGLLDKVTVPDDTLTVLLVRVT